MTEASIRQLEDERSRVFSLVGDGDGMSRKELNNSIATVMQHHCGPVKNSELLNLGLIALSELRQREGPRLRAKNPHELVCSLEVLNVLTNAELVLHACLARKASAKYLMFYRSDFPEDDPPPWKKFVTVSRNGSEVSFRELPLDYYGDLMDEYATHNSDYEAEGNV
mgnify:CR=1 FL=1